MTNEMLLKILNLSCIGLKKNNAGKGINAGYCYFLFFPPCFQKGILLRVL